MDTISVEHLSIIGKHGVNSHEWSNEQSFLVDMTVLFDTKKSAATDDLDDSIDYIKLCNIARSVIEGESVYLIEKLATDIASEILKDKRIERVEVTIQKPSALPSGVPSVRIVRENS